MGSHAHLHLGTYIQIPYKTVETTETKRGCVNPECSTGSKANYVVRPAQKFCQDCGQLIQDVPYKVTEQMAYRGTELEQDNEDEFSIIEGSEIGDRNGFYRGFQFLISNDAEGSLYGGLDENDSGVFPYGGDEYQLDIRKFADKHYILWNLIKLQHPEARLLQGLILYHN